MMLISTQEFTRHTDVPGSYKADDANILIALRASIVKQEAQLTQIAENFETLLLSNKALPYLDAALVQPSQQKHECLFDALLRLCAAWINVLEF
jgi:hypothetical protein